MAPLYEKPFALPRAALEAEETAAPDDEVLARVNVTANTILTILRTRPRLFHFAGHAVNRNDHA